MKTVIWTNRGYTKSLSIQMYFLEHYLSKRSHSQPRISHYGFIRIQYILLLQNRDLHLQLYSILLSKTMKLFPLIKREHKYNTQLHEPINACERCTRPHTQRRLCRCLFRAVQSLPLPQPHSRASQWSVPMGKAAKDNRLGFPSLMSDRPSVEFQTPAQKRAQQLVGKDLAFFW